MRYVVGVLAMLAMLVLGCGGAPSAAKESATPASAGDRAADTLGHAEKILQIATGDFHTCGLVVGGTVVCWGRNRDGELGDGGVAGNRSRPMTVPNLRDVEQIAAGHGFACARTKDGAVRCWGSGKILGDDRAVEKSRPTEVQGISGAVDLKAGGVVACARMPTGAVRCWGTDKIKVGAPSAGADEIAVSGAHACARTLDSRITCWGEGLAKNPTLSGNTIVKATALSTGDTFVCAIVDGNVQCWGRNDQGELGKNPDPETRTKPLPVKNATGATRLSSAESRTCTVLRDASIRCWGTNYEGELGRGSKTGTEGAGAVTGIQSAADVAVGAGHACALLTDGTVSCWGGNRNGQLGDGTLESRTEPVHIRW